ncbi:MAG TPA: glycoside hydrolase family 11 protein [Polyangiaceae bacterium]|nr:glycoside hydrolase family 11 protein [Polyangiaceae bacterium]
MNRMGLCALPWLAGVTFTIGACQPASDPTPTGTGTGGSNSAAVGGAGGHASGDVGPNPSASGAGGGAKAGTAGGSGGASAGMSAAAGNTASAGSSSGSGGLDDLPSGGSTGTAGSSPGGSGGKSGVGGASGSGGASSAGSAGAAAEDPPCPTPTPRTGGKQYCSPPSNGNAGGNYSYDLWSDGKGSGCMTVYGADAAFKANWMNVGDWIARVGLSFDKTKTYDQLGTFSADFAYTMTGITSGGFGNVGVYGWSVNPLHEFYIEENWLGKAPNFTKVGTFTIDGEGTYDVMTNTQTNQPNITGTNQTFVQFWSVRKTKRQCGHISISKHFEQWKSMGLELGKMEEARFSVEGQNNSGTIDFTTASLVVTH